MAYDVTGEQKIVLRGGLGLYFDRPSSTTFSGGVNNPPTSGTVTVRYCEPAEPRQRRALTTQGAPSLSAFPRDIKLPSDTQWNAEVQMALPWASSLSVAYVGHHSFNTFQGTNINTVDLGATFLPENQDTTLAASTIPGATPVSDDLMRADPRLRQHQRCNGSAAGARITPSSCRSSAGSRTASRSASPTRSASTIGSRLPRGSTTPRTARTGCATIRRWRTNCSATTTRSPTSCALNFVWDLPDLRADNAALQAIGYVINDWQFSGIWDGRTGTAYTVGFSYQSGGGNRT